ncbi:MAG: hypothetical protein J5966_10335 [Lachnospiraceae bacterium]|nr:hypothetical protein [Lachnospiraceae bacterium]
MSNKRFYAAVTCIVLLVACMPLFTLNCIGGHDIAYHLLRIEALKTGILSGRPFLRVNMLFFGGMGYASSLFYPDLLLYFPAILRALGAGINLSYHLFTALCIILGFFSAFFCARHISKSNYAGIVTAVIFTLYQYHIYDIYTRSAVGEFTAVIFVPFVIAGLHDFINDEEKKPWFLITGMTGVLLCHTITTVLCILLCILAVTADISRIIRKPGKLLKLLTAALIVLAVTAFYWLPVLEMVSTGAFGNDFYFDTAYEAAKLWEVSFNEYNRMGTAVFILLFAGLLIRKRQSFADLCAIAGLFIAVCATGIFPWERLGGILGFIQFPWRFFVITGPLLAFAEGIYIHQLADETGGGDEGSYVSRFILLTVVSVMLVSAVGNFRNNTETYYSYSQDYFEYAPFTAEVIGGEWLPDAASDRDALIELSDTAVTDKGEEVGIRRYKNEIYIDEVPGDTEYIDVPFIYYKGYAAESVNDRRGLAVSGEGRNGSVRVFTAGAGAVHVYYKGTAIQHAGDAVSAGAVIALIMYFLIPSVRKRKGSGADK